MGRRLLQGFAWERAGSRVRKSAPVTAIRLLFRPGLFVLCQLVNIEAESLGQIDRHDRESFHDIWSVAKGLDLVPLFLSLNHRECS